MGEIYDERKESGNDELPILTVSIHTGVSDGELDEDSLGKRVKRSEDKSLYKIAKRGDLVFNMMRAWQGAIGSVRTTGMVSPAYIVAKPKYKIDSMFFDYMVKTKTMINRIHRLSYGVTDFRLRLYWDAFVSINCSIPKISEQYKISSFLSLLDNRITKQRELIEKLKTYKRGALSVIFSREIRFNDKEGNLFPDWQTVKFSELYTQVSEKNDGSFGTDKIISVANMYFKSDVTIGSEDYLKSYNICRLGDIAFEGNKSKSFSFGRLVENHIGDGIVSHVFIVFRPLNTDHNIDYWRIAINYEPIMGKILSKCTKKSTMMTDIVPRDFLQQTIAVPCPEEQRRIADFLSKIDKYINKQTEYLDKLTSIKSGLLQQMFI